MLYKEIPFLRLLIAFLIGITAASVFPFNSVIIPLVISGLIILIVCFLAYKHNINPVNYGIALYFFLSVTGYTLYMEKNNRLISIDNTKTEFLLRVKDFPDERQNSFRIPLDIIQKASQQVPRGNHLMLYVPKTTDVSNMLPGTILGLNCKLESITDFDTDDNFDYKKYMFRRGFGYTAYSPEPLVSISWRPNLRQRALVLRSSILEIYVKKGINEDRLPLIAALTLGYREMLDPETIDTFSRSGAMHILAVSGLHVGILSYFILGLLSFMKKRARIIRLLITLCIIWTFVLITGMSSSVLRAALMFTFIHTGQIINRRVNPVNSVLASAFILLVINPFAIYDTGFQLSYSAVLIIIIFYKDLYSLLNIKNRLIERIWSISVISILAQLGTLPLVIYYFNRVPVLALITNLFAIPLAFLILIMGFLLLITSGLSFIPDLISWFLNMFSGTLEIVAARIASFRFSAIETVSINDYHLVLLIITIPLVLTFILKPRQVHPHLVFTALILCLL